MGTTIVGDGIKPFCRKGSKFLRISKRNILINNYLQFFLLLEMSNYLLSLHVNFAPRKSSEKSLREWLNTFCREEIRPFHIACSPVRSGLLNR